MADIQIVTIAPDDWQQYRQIRLEALQAEPQAFTSPYEEAAQRPPSYWQERLSAARAGEKSRLLFAKENERIVGMIGSFSAGDSQVVDIISVYVTRDARRRGIASALMAAILQEAEQTGAYRKAVLTVNGAQTAAVSLYQQFGFQIVGELSGVLGNGNPFRGFVMEKELGHS